MTFDEALSLAHAIHSYGGWYVLAIEPASGEKLEEDHWSVMAISTLNWHYIHYFERAGSRDEWPRYAEAAEAGARRRASTHEQ